MNGKIALGALGGIGLITTVSVVSSRSGSLDPSWEEEMPSFRFLSSDATFMSNSQDNSSYRFGYIYSELLVGDADINDVWWEWSYKNLEEDLNSRNKPSKETFTSAAPSSNVPNSAVSLTNWCKSVYELDTRSHEPFDAPGSIFNNSSVWKYCSPIQQSPVSLQNSRATYSAGTIGNLKASSLLDTNKNKRIWYYRNKFFDEQEVDSFEEGVRHDAFVKGKKEGRKVQDICADAYKQNMEEALIRKVMFFCSISQII